ncbi:type VI secretion system baseplate subunit TssF [Burkholderia sp. WAC0059]|uniref:type VI secretion system baseplate subunit TssF n=1 Tax=Burkholderia sp. WAC0059 TaxID=2066022 RepID=UPI000C7F0377|nr:type VI secretion system baseplate subunit TssF [Burkholderia sp. WAC0059]PLY99967.1 type VI secretion system baseplate subunit TssF [Burkholderia sp. WAC0059]
MAEDDILDYYERELAYLRLQGADFARRYPKVASRLALHGTESLDPHTERLVEATAFLAARVHRDLDRTFPQIAQAVLENVCPSLVQPVPSMTVAQFALDLSQGKVTAGFRVPRHTALQARTESGDVCRFRTAWDTVLWPVRIGRVEFTEDAVLQLSLECEPGIDFAELELDQLRFHLYGDWMVTMPLYELLVAGVESVEVRPEGARPAPASWREVGYESGDAVLPQPSNEQPAYRLMQEYFSFARKFHFFDLSGLAGRLGNGRRCELLLRLKRAPRGLGMVSAQNFRLGCTPIVNLFAQTSEPIVVDRRRHEYRLVADQQREAITEIHSITSVVASDPSTERSTVVPGFAQADRFDGHGATVFWTARRERSLREGLSGTDLHLGFVDSSSTGAVPAESVVYAHLLCTNRRLAAQVPAGVRMLVERVSQSPRVRCLYEPTVQRDPPLGSDTLWRLVSLLTLDYQSLAGGAVGCSQLQQMLRLFAADGTREQDQIRGIRSMAARGAIAHVGGEAWRGYCRGTEVEVEFDPDAFVGGSPLMMGAVLARFLSLYTSVNSFVRLVVRRGDGIWKQWEPMAGCQPLL